MSQGQFWPSSIVVFGVCLSVCPPSVCVCGKHVLVRKITHHPFMLGSPNSDHRCKRPCLRSLLCWVDWHWPSRSNLTWKSKFTPFWACCAITLHSFKLGPTNLDRRCKIYWLRFLLFWGRLSLTSPVYFHRFCVSEIFVRPKKTESVPHPKWLRTYMFANAVVLWTVRQWSCIFSVTIARFAVLDSA